MSKPAKVHTLASILAGAEEEGACLLWEGSLGTGSTPQIYEKGSGMVPVRKLLTRLLGTDSGAAYYAAKCGNPRCIAPEHISQRTQRTQSLVMAKRAHTTSKTAHRVAVAAWRRANPVKLDIEQARAIRADERPSLAVAADYGIHRSMVCRIRKGTAWAEHANPFAGLMASNESARRQA